MIKTHRRRVIRSEHIKALDKPIEEARAELARDKDRGFHDWWMSSLKHRVAALLMAKSIMKKMHSGQFVLVSAEGLKKLVDDYGDAKVIADEYLANKQQAIQQAEWWLGPPNDI